MISDLFNILWGATWGNNTAAAEWALVIGSGGWLLRHRIGRRLAAWWDRHYGPLAVERHKQAMREHQSERPPQLPAGTSAGTGLSPINGTF